MEIHTECNFKDGWVVFHASIECPKGTFSGHALGKVGGEKAFEKLETIAVGRALAFAGYLASGEIASFEEMQEFDRTVSSEISRQQYDQLKRDWWNVYGEEFDKEEAGEQFAAWVHQETELDLPTVANWSEWTAADLLKCRKALEAQTESALAVSGLT